MLRYLCLVAMLMSAMLVSSGCIKRAPANVFPGSDAYEKRVSSLKISPTQAYEIAHEAAVTDNRLQFLSRRPTVIVKRTYVFSMPQSSGATLQGYHVNGENGEVKFVNDKKTVTPR